MNGRHDVPHRPTSTKGQRAPTETPESKFLVGRLRAAFDRSGAANCRLDASARLNWREILALAGRHRIRPMLHASLAKDPVATVPAACIGALREFAADNIRRNLFLLRELFNLLDFFDLHSIPVAAFKGPTLAWNAYGSAGLREAGDLDLLVRKRDVARARKLLVSRGFVPIFPTASPREARWLQNLAGEREANYVMRHSEHHLLNRQSLVNVDLHWALALRDFWILLDDRKVWNWLAAQKLAGRTILGFPDEQTLLMLCINGAKDCWERLDRVCDVAQWIVSHPNLNWQKLLRGSRSEGALRILFLGLSLAENLLGIELPLAAQREISHDRAIPGLVVEIRRRLFAPTTSEAETASFRRTQLHLFMRERLQDRIGYCLAHLEPTVGDWAAIPLPATFAFVHYLTRPLRLLTRYRAETPAQNACAHAQCNAM